MCVCCESEAASNDGAESGEGVVAVSVCMGCTRGTDVCLVQVTSLR